MLDEFRDIVSPIILLAEPLLVSSLLGLLNIPRAAIFSRLGHLYSVLNVLSNIETPVRMFYLSFRDFLLDPKRTTHKFLVNEKQYYKKLTTKCQEVINGYLRKDIYNLRAPTLPVDTSKIKATLPEYIRYTCLY